MKKLFIIIFVITIPLGCSAQQTITSENLKQPNIILLFADDAGYADFGFQGSKEMARLLGISVQSVHTTRYRLRKKMKLDRSVNLEDFIANL